MFRLFRLLSSESQNTSVNNGKKTSAVFKDFKFCLTDYSSKEVSELMLEWNQRPAKNSKVILVEKEDLLKVCVVSVVNSFTLFIFN